MDQKRFSPSANDIPTLSFSRTTTLVPSSFPSPSHTPPLSPSSPSKSLAQNESYFPKLHSADATVTPSTSSHSSHSPEKPIRHYWRIIGACICFFAVGWGDAATGPILPQIKAAYNLDYMMASMMFMIGSIGYAIATFFVQPLEYIFGLSDPTSQRLSILPKLFKTNGVQQICSTTKGRYLSLFVWGVCLCLYFLIAAASPSYYGLLIGYFIGGMAKSVLLAQMNVYWTTNPRASGISVLHGIYGLGAMVAPLTCQTLLATGHTWRQFFFISVTVAGVNLLYNLWAFYPTQADWELEKQVSTERIVDTVVAKRTLPGKGDIESSPVAEHTTTKKIGMWAIFCMPYVWVIAGFLGIYQGSETIAQGYIVTYLLRERNANPNTVGYVASGFWGGLTIGRVTWGFLSHWFSQKTKIFYVNFALIIGIVFHLLIWHIDDMLANAVMVSILGLLVGPTYPLILDIATNPRTKHKGAFSPLPLLPADIQLTAIAIGSSAAAMGGATCSLGVGIAASKYGAWVIEPIALAVVGAVLIFWIGTQITYRYIQRKN